LKKGDKMNKKLVRTMSIVLSIILVIGIAYIGNFFLQKNIRIQAENLAKLENKPENEQITQEGFDKNQEEEEEQTTENTTTKTNEPKQIEEEKIINEQTGQDQNIQAETSNMTDEELINELGNIIGMTPEESSTKYDATYISRFLKIVENRMRSMSDEQRQRIKALLEKKKLSPTKENE
jgi:cytoskeletal protein RodZ